MSNEVTPRKIITTTPIKATVVNDNTLFKSVLHNTNEMHKKDKQKAAV